MKVKSYRVYFARTYCGNKNQSIAKNLLASFETYGPNLTPISLGEDTYQVRDLVKTGSIWQGVFARLRADAPHIVDSEGTEREIDLEEGDRILDKSHFIFRANSNVLIWQVNRTAASLLKLADYFANLFEDFVSIPMVMNDGEIQKILDGSVYEISFDYARPDVVSSDAPVWNQSAMDMMNRVDAAQAKFLLRAARFGSLATQAKQMIRQLVNDSGANKVRVRLTDESEPIELFSAPLKDTIEVQLDGRYAVSSHAFQGLEDAYDRNKRSIPSSGSVGV
jgi:hypothetical protein